MVETRGKRILYSAVFMMMIGVLLFLSAGKVWAAGTDSSQELVRVAFPSQGGMGDVGEGGDLIGYNYSYLQELAQYAGWELSYETFEGQSGDESIMSAMEMVMSGEADLIGPMLKSDQVEELFEFPENSYGTVYTTLCSLEKSDINTVNFAQIKPLRVAVYASATERNQEVQAYLDQMNITYQLVPCEDTDEQISALQEGKAEVLSSITLSYFEGTRMVAEFAPRPYYLVSTKGNTKLIKKLDHAVETLNYTRPHFQEQLQEEFFGDTSGGYVLTDEEEKCMHAIKSLRVLCASNYPPFSSESKDGKAQGLLVSILNDFASDNQISIEYTLCADANEMETKWETGGYNGLIGFPLSSEYCAKNALVQSNPVLSVNMEIFRKQKSGDEYGESTIAIYKSLVDEVNLSKFQKVLECDKLEDIYDAVKTGKAEYGCVNQLSCDYKDYETGTTYVSTPLLGETLDVCFAISRNLDSHVIATLNKYIYTRSDSTKTTYLSEASQHENDRSLSTFIRLNPVQAAMILAGLGVLVIGLVLVTISANKNRKRNVELEKANAAKSEFLSRMSHDIRTPMNAILGFTELGKKDMDSPERLNADLERISSSGEFLLGLVNDVLDMTKIESNAMKLNPKPYSKVEFQRQIETLFLPQCAEKKIELSVNFNPNLPDCLYVDKLRFNQIFFNILSNAVKFTPENGKIQISGETLDTKENQCRMQFVISDNGIGMSEEFQKTMFEAFSQEQQHITGREGTGLGLSIVKSLVGLMDGTIQVKSVPGKGTTFTLMLTAVTCEAPSEVKKETDVAYKDQIPGKKILLCEDHPINTQLACRILTSGGAQVDCAANGLEGVKQFVQSDLGEYDVILMDIRMPVMDGLEATRKIRALDREDARRIPIIAMTANAFADDVEICLEAGMNAHLAKPFEAKKLYEVILEQCRK